MTNRKDEQRKMKQPDDFQRLGLNLMDWLLRKKSMVGGFLGLVVLVAVAVVAWQAWRGKAADDRRNELAEIEKTYAGETEKADKLRTDLGQELQALEAPIPPQDPASADPAPAAPPVDPAKKADLEAKIKAVKADRSESLGKYRAFFEKNKDNAEGWLAGMRASKTLLDGGSRSDAEGILKAIATHSKDNTFYAVQSRLSLIGMMEEEKRYDDALKTTDELLAAVEIKQAKPKKDRGDKPEAVTTPPANDLAAQALFIRGNLLTMKGDKAEAVKAYDALIEKYPESRESKKARGMKSLL